MGNSWYYAKGNQQIGPVEFSALRDYVARGVVGMNDLVWTEGMPQWQPASLVPELSPPPMAVPAGQPMGQPTATLPYGAPAQHYSQLSHQQSATPYAGFWLRFAAYIIDYIITTVAGFIGGLILGVIIGVARAANSPTASTQSLAQLGGGLVGLIIGWLYFALMESSSAQATLGKLAIGLRVTDMDGNRISFGRATGRFFAKIISALTCLVGYMMAGWTAQKQALHDMLANTLVVRANG